MIKKVTLLKKQNSKWEITTSHSFNNRNYTVDDLGNFYKDGVLRIVKPDGVSNYWHFLIDDNNKKMRFKIHQISKQTFNPSGLKDGLSVDHKDRNRHNNKLSNYRYATRKEQYSNRENKEHKFKKVICLNNQTIYKSCQHAEIALGLVKNTVARVARGERKKIHGYNFEFATGNELTHLL